MDAPLRIELLGGLQVRRGAEMGVRFRTRKTGALLAYLAYFQRRQPRDVLIEVLWPDSDPQAARNNLRVALSSLRRQLQSPAILSGSAITATRAFIQLNPATFCTDVAQFEAALHAANLASGTPEQIQHLAAAVDLYRGPLLSGYYESWIPSEENRLEEMFFQALQRLIAHWEQAGDFQRALHYAQQGVQAAPLHEEIFRELMRLYAASGEPAVALQRFRELERRLQKQFDTIPSTATRALAQEIKSQVPRRKTSKSSLQQSVLVAGAGSQTKSAGAPEPLFQVDSSGMAHRELPSPHAQGGYRHNLPAQLTRFFGREREIQHLQTLLLSHEYHVVTLTGPGGCGKTRLALEVVRRLLPHWQGGLWFVPLADLNDIQLLPEAILDAMNIARVAGKEPVTQLIEVLSQEPVLLLLDNFEQLLDDDANPLWELLQSLPDLFCLVTSRRRLHLAGEREFVVPPLPVPHKVEDPSHLSQFDCVQLFIDRAQVARPDFRITRHNAAHVAELCSRLDGIPLAIELAAARSQVLSPSQIVKRLEERIEMLAVRHQNLPTRHRTMRAAIDWSFETLLPALQHLFVQLSVFRGGWTFDSVTPVCYENGLPNDVLDDLEQLRDCSLLMVEEVQDGAAMRFRMLETLRLYGWELLAPEEQIALSRRHARYFLELANQARQSWAGPHQDQWVERFELEQDNFRAALEWSLEHDVNLALHLVIALCPFWEVRGHFTEGRRWLGRVINKSSRQPAELRAKVLMGMARLFLFQGDVEPAPALLEQSLDMAQQSGRVGGIAEARRNIATVALGMGDVALARPMLEEDVEFYRRLNDRLGMAFSMQVLGIALLLEDDPAARPMLEESLGILREFGEKSGIGRSLWALSILAREEKQFDMAFAMLLEATQLALDIRHDWGLVYLLEAFAYLAVAQARPQRAALLLAAAEAARRDMDSPLLPAIAPVHDEFVQAVQIMLGDEEFEDLRARGAMLSLAAAVDFALRDADSV